MLRSFQNKTPSSDKSKDDMMSSEEERLRTQIVDGERQIKEELE